jgi:hypothetical protein
MVRCTTILALSLSLAAFAVWPIGSCDLFAAQASLCNRGSAATDCVCPDRAPQPVEIEGTADNACCGITQAPPPDSSAPVSAPEASTEPLPPPESFILPQPAREFSALSLPVVSPPELQPLLCVFLI